MTFDAKPRPSRRVRTESSPFHWLPSRPPIKLHLHHPWHRPRAPGRVTSYSASVSHPSRSAYTVHIARLEEEALMHAGVHTLGLGLTVVWTSWWKRATTSGPLTSRHGQRLPRWSSATTASSA